MGTRVSWDERHMSNNTMMPKFGSCVHIQLCNTKRTTCKGTHPSTRLNCEAQVRFGGRPERPRLEIADDGRDSRGDRAEPGDDGGDYSAPTPALPRRPKQSKQAEGMSRSRPPVALFQRRSPEGRL